MTSQPLPRRMHTVVVGAGQAGLAMSWYLRQAGREHILLERRTTLGSATLYGVGVDAEHPAGRW